MTDDTRASMKAPGTNWSGLRSGRKGEISKASKPVKPKDGAIRN